MPAEPLASSLPPLLRAALARASWALPCTFAVLCFANLRAALYALDTPRELLYLSVLAALFGLGVALTQVALALLDGSRLGRHPARAALLLALATQPFACPLGEHLALAETLRAKGYAAPPLIAVGMLAVTLLVLTVWALMRYVHTRGRALLLILPLLLCLSWLDGSVGFSRQGSALLFLAAQALLLAHLVQVLAGERALVPGAVASALIGLTGLCVAAAPEVVAQGRRHAVVRLSSIAQIDVQAWPFGPRFSGYHASKGAPRACPRVPASARAQARAAQHGNVVVITIDTVRLDHATMQVNGKPLMPNLQRFFAGSLRAPYAVTGYPATMMALSSAFTGLMPSRLVLTSGPPPSLFRALRPHFDDVTAILPAQRYFTRGAIESYLLQGARRLVARGKPDQTALAIQHLRTMRKQHKRHFAWLHYFEPHSDYTRHPEHDFGSSETERYMSELAYVDARLGRVLDELERSHAYDDTLVLLFADHGESFGERGHHHHHYHLYPWLVKVPFALRVPGQAARTLGGPVHLTDVAATVLDFVGLAPALPLDGVSLLGGDPSTGRALLSEEFPMQSGVLERYAQVPVLDGATLAQRIERLERGRDYPSKVSVLSGEQELVVHRGTNVSELYDLTRDPGAEHDLGDQDHDTERELRAKLERYLRDVSPLLGCVPRQ